MRFLPHVLFDKITTTKQPFGTRQIENNKHILHLIRTPKNSAWQSYLRAIVQFQMVYCT